MQTASQNGPHPQRQCLGLPRIVAALLENHQTAEGIRIPAALQRYTGFDRIA